MSHPRPRQYDLIAFDWDGTLYDSTALIVRCIQDAVRDVGGTVPSAQRIFPRCASCARNCEAACERITSSG